MRLSLIRLPSLEIQTTLGPINLSAYVGHQLVVYFYPKDDTPGCTIEGQDFSAAHPDFLAAGTQVIGVSRDSLASHEKFIAKYGLTIALVADTDESLCKAFDVIKTKNMYGKQVLGIERSTFLFDAKGSLAKAWRGVKVPGHVEEVLGAARALHQ
ncbi:redoxin domain-containing protein [Betaproteobacteria bacterium LSUCC0115]|nr:redoxin domain-containing protein [Burkholderiales bacterium LSUCC0115]